MLLALFQPWGAPPSDTTVICVPALPNSCSDSSSAALPLLLSPLKSSTTTRLTAEMLASRVDRGGGTACGAVRSVQMLGKLRLWQLALARFAERHLLADGC